jgi:threonine 3-dehydrogenase
MKAIVKRAPEPGLWLEEVPVPKAGTNEVLIRVLKASICGTDLHIFNWDEWAQRTIRPPLVLGHEFVGEVAEIGPGVARYRVGDRVTAEGHLVCGVCRNCRAGKPHLCHRTLGLGVHRDGAFAEFVVMPESNLWPVHPDVPSEIAAFMDPLGNATHCALSFDMVGEDVLITGAGPIGCLAAAICRFAGARHIVVTDRNEYRLGIARRMGASRAVHIEKTSLEETIRELNMSNGFDIGLEMSGHPEAFRGMVRSMYNGGRIALLGFLPPSTTIDWNHVILKSLTLKGVYGREMYETWYKMTQLLRSGLDVRPVLTHRLRFEEYERAFAIIREGNCGKIVLEWS